ncbi:calponin-2 isoform X1 [Falco cherrug]|uniref:calponin-2 isoform X1 n=1 Tax=Falco cherrug TaxID=345164 RepID=UPI002478C9BA|nr:calponin-2 isoform X1 [Falco cherrug]
MSSSQFNKGPSYGLSAEVKNRQTPGHRSRPAAPGAGGDGPDPPRLRTPFAAAPRSFSAFRFPQLRVFGQVAPARPRWGGGWWPRWDSGRSSPQPTAAPRIPPAGHPRGTLGHPGLAHPSHSPAELPPSRRGAGRGKGNRVGPPASRQLPWLPAPPARAAQPSPPPQCRRGLGAGGQRWVLEVPPSLPLLCPLQGAVLLWRGAVALWAQGSRRAGGSRAGAATPSLGCAARGCGWGWAPGTAATPGSSHSAGLCPALGEQSLSCGHCWPWGSWPVALRGCALPGDMGAAGMGTGLGQGGEGVMSHCPHRCQDSATRGCGDVAAVAGAELPLLSLAGDLHFITGQRRAPACTWAGLHQRRAGGHVLEPRCWVLLGASA